MAAVAATGTDSTPVDIVERKSPGLARTGISASVYLFLVYLSFSMSGLPFFTKIMTMECERLQSLPTPEIYALVAGWISIWTLVTGIPQVLTCSFYGVLGDAFGRRWSLTMPIIGGILQGLAVYFVPNDQPHLLMVLGCVTSLLGGSFVTNAAAMATLADMTQGSTPAMRSQVFALIEAANYAALLCGPVLGGYISTALGWHNSFLLLGGIGVLNLLIVLFTYKETLEPERRRAFTWRRANPLSALAMFAHCKNAVCLGGLFACGLFAQTAGIGSMGLWAKQIAGFTQTEMGTQASAYLGSGFVGLMLLLPVLARFLRLTTIMSIALFWQMMLWLAMWAATTPVSLFGIPALATISVTFFPIVRTGLTNLFGKDRYGESLAALGTMEQLVSVVAGVVGGQLYEATNTVTFKIGSLTFGNLVFPCAAAAALIGVVFSLFLKDIPKNIDGLKSKELMSSALVFSSVASIV